MMAGKWEGFTEDDLKYYLEPEPAAANTKFPARNVTNIGNSKTRNAPKERRFPSSRKVSDSEAGLPEAALLLKTVTEVKQEDTSPRLLNGGAQPLSPEVVAAEGMPETPKEIDHVPVVASEETLEVFHARQKLLEEQNRQRKDYLAKVLSDRKKQTTQEARRLQKIQEELHKLDILLSDDVGILRDEIEVAAKDFGEAQKRFNRAEKEFLEAKQSLFAKLERKELLTKHLCTIIEQNELRKAQKLSELMNKLDVEAPSADPQIYGPAEKTEQSPPVDANGLVTAKVDTLPSKQDQSS